MLLLLLLCLHVMLLLLLPGLCVMLEAAVRAHLNWHTLWASLAITITP
jgi:hypothetical protein